MGRERHRSSGKPHTHSLSIPRPCPIFSRCLLSHGRPYMLIYHHSQCLFPSSVLTIKTRPTVRCTQPGEAISAGEKLITCSPISLFQDGNKLAKHATEEVDESSRDHSQTFSRHDCLVSLEKSGNKGWLLSASLLVSVATLRINVSRLTAYLAAAFRACQ